MLSVFGARRRVCPVGEVTTTRRIEPSVPVTTWLTVPSVAPLLLLTVRPMLRPGSAVVGTLLWASTLLELELLIPIGDACISPWLVVVAVAGGTVVVVLVCSALFVFERKMPCGDAFNEPWLLARAPMAAPLGPPIAPD